MVEKDNTFFMFLKCNAFVKIIKKIMQRRIWYSLISYDLQTLEILVMESLTIHFYQLFDQIKCCSHLFI